MTKLIFMKETMDKIPEKKFEKMLKIGELKVDENEVPYLSIDLDTYLETNLEQDE